MESFISEEFNIDDIVVVSHIDSPGIYMLARICHKWIHQCQSSNPNPLKPPLYTYDVRTFHYSEKPFTNFYSTDSTFMMWKEIHYFATPESFKDFMDYHLKEVITISIK